MGRRAGRLFSLVVVVLVAAAGALFWFESAATAPGPLAEPATVIVPPGSSLSVSALFAYGRGTGLSVRPGAPYPESFHGFEWRFSGYRLHPWFIAQEHRLGPQLQGPGFGVVVPACPFRFQFG